MNSCETQSDPVVFATARPKKISKLELLEKLSVTTLYRKQSNDGKRNDSTGCQLPVLDSFHYRVI